MDTVTVLQWPINEINFKILSRVRRNINGKEDKLGPRQFITSVTRPK